MAEQFHLKLPEISIHSSIIFMLIISFVYDAIRRDFYESRTKRIQFFYNEEIARTTNKLNGNARVYQPPTRSLLGSRLGRRDSARGYNRLAVIQRSPRRSPTLTGLFRASRWLIRRQVGVTEADGNISAVGSCGTGTGAGDGASNAARGASMDTFQAIGKWGEENEKTHHDRRGFESAACPIGEMPKGVRLYQNISTVYMVFALLKYAYLSAINYLGLKTNPLHTCYLAGRMSLVPDMAFEMPCLTLLIVICHIMFRYIHLVHQTHTRLDPLLFVLYDQKTVAEIENRLTDLPSGTVESRDIYLRHSMFYRRVELGEHSTRYLLRSNRTLDHWKKMTDFVKFNSVLAIAGMIILMMPFGLISCFNIYSHDYFDDNYGECRQLSSQPDDANFKWSFSDPFRLYGLALDIIENFILLLYSGVATIWPIVMAIICSEDLALKVDDLCEQVSSLRYRIIESYQMSDRRLDSIVGNTGDQSDDDELDITDDDNNNYTDDDDDQDDGDYETDTLDDEGGDEFDEYRNDSFDIRFSHEGGPVNPLIRRAVWREIENDIKLVQSDIIDTFEQVAQIDKFMSTFAAYHMFVWSLLTLGYQLMAIMRDKVFVVNVPAIILELVSFIVMTMSFSKLGRTNTLGIKLYKLICGVMARDPNFDSTKPTWIWLLEYYHERHSRYSLHMGSFVLSMGNYLKSMTWFVSFASILLNLIILKVGHA